MKLWPNHDGDHVDPSWIEIAIVKVMVIGGTAVFLIGWVNYLTS